jgi:hypothetical protein
MENRLYIHCTALPGLLFTNKAHDFATYAPVCAFMQMTLQVSVRLAFAVSADVAGNNLEAIDRRIGRGESQEPFHMCTLLVTLTYSITEPDEKAWRH